MRRRHARGESVDDGKVGYLERLFRACVVFLGCLWECLVEVGMEEVSAEVVRGAKGLVMVAEEVGAFVRDMDFAGVGFLSGEWDWEARR